MHHAVASAGAVFVMGTKKCSIYAFSAIFAELNSVFLALRAISHLNRSKSGKFYRFFVFPNLLLTFVYTRIFIHGLALRQSYRLITKDLPKRKKGEEKKESNNRLDTRTVGVMGTLGGGAIWVNNILILRSLLRLEGWKLV